MGTDDSSAFHPTRSTLDWLLEPSNPPVRYWTLVNLLGRPARDGEVAAAREAVADYPPVRESLRDLLNVPVVERVDLSVLAMVGLTRAVPQVREICDRVLGGGIRPQGGQGCYIGHVLGGLLRMGYAGDERLDPMIAAILREQRFLDGNRPGTELRYGRPNVVCAGSHSCFSAVTWSLWAMTALPARRRTPQIRDFLRRGADFLRAHRLYKTNHGRSKPVRSEWLKLQLPFGLGWRTDVLHILEVAGRVGLARDGAAADAVAFVLSRRDGRGRWPLDVRNPDRTTGCGPLWREEVVGRPSKWVTLTALTQLKRFSEIASRVAAGELPAPPAAQPEEDRFAPYPYAREPAEERNVRERWTGAGMEPALDALLGFVRGAKLQTGWHKGLVIGPSWCREWCAAEVAWVPRPRFDRAWPVCRIYFLAPRGRHCAQELSRRLGIPVEDSQDKARFPKLYRAAFWRIKIAPWRRDYDEIALTLRDVDELRKALLLLEESLGSLDKTIAR